MESNKNAQTIRQLLLSNIPEHWDGKQSILEMKKLGSRNWKQTEWPGWYFEFMATRCLINSFGSTDPFKMDGKRNVDYSHMDENWDFKHHSISNKKRCWIPSNDVELIHHCIRERGHWGLIVGMGECTLGPRSRDCEFRLWHTALCGGPSAYSKRIEKEGAIPRARKITGSLEEIIIIQFSSLRQLEDATREGWANDGFQKNMRNSNNKPRNAKYKFKLNELVDRNIAK
jgi:hypothetical protein